MSGPGFIIYRAEYMGCNVQLQQDGGRNTFFREHKRGKPTRFGTEAELLDSFPKIAERGA